MTDAVGMESDGMNHIHAWACEQGSCVCGEPVPTWLQAAWDRYAEKTVE